MKHTVLYVVLIAALVGLGGRRTARAAECYGLFVGLNRYSSSYGPGDLNYCTNDVSAVRSALVGGGAGWVATNTSTLFNSAATKTKIRAAISNFAKQAKSGDVFLYNHSSHGGNANLSQAAVYLCTYNADYHDYELAADLAAFASGVRVVVIVDACHSSGLFEETGALSVGEQRRQRRATAESWDIAKSVTDHMARERASLMRRNAKAAAAGISPSEIGWMTACAYNEYSYESGAVGHGYFTYGLLNGFLYGDQNGDGQASFQELFDFAVIRIPFPDQNPKCLNSAVLSSVIATTNAGITPPGDAWDYADNTPAGATVLVPSRTPQLHGPHTFQQAFDEADWFAIPVRARQSVTLASTHLASDVDGELYRYTPDAGYQLIRNAYDNAGNNNFRITYKSPQDDTVYLKVHPCFSNNTMDNYTLHYVREGTDDSLDTLYNGVTVGVPTLSKNGDALYRVMIPEGTTNLLFSMSGGSGDADLYVAHGYLPVADCDYSSEEYGNTESIRISNPAAGEWLIQVFAYAASSGMSLTATYTPSNHPASAQVLDVQVAHGVAISTVVHDDYAPVDAIPVYSATNALPDGSWNWHFKTNTTLTRGQAHILLDANAGMELLSFGKPGGPVAD